MYKKLLIIGILVLFIVGCKSSVRDEFNEVTKKVENVMSGEPLPISPDVNSPITLSREQVVLKIDLVAEIKTSVFCANSAGCSGNALLTCKDDFVRGESSKPKVINYNEYETGSILVYGLNSGTTICDIVYPGIRADGSDGLAQFVVQVS